MQTASLRKRDSAECWDNGVMVSKARRRSLNTPRLHYSNTPVRLRLFPHQIL